MIKTKVSSRSHSHYPSSKQFLRKGEEASRGAEQEDPGKDGGPVLGGAFSSAHGRRLAVEHPDPTRRTEREEILRKRKRRQRLVITTFRSFPRGESVSSGGSRFAVVFHVYIEERVDNGRVRGGETAWRPLEGRRFSAQVESTEG